VVGGDGVLQSLLLAGYAYAHYLMRLRNRMLPAAIHLYCW